MSNEKCPCNSGKDYASCCEPIIKKTKKAETPEALMRSRYTAYAKTEVDHIIDSTHADMRDANDREEVRKWSEKSDWMGLEIIRTEGGAEKDDVGYVEFIARYMDHGINLEHHEIAEFRRVKGDWYFYDGQMVAQQPFVRTSPKIGRNDPCPCGSGKKYKKCCGSDAGAQTGE